jgi:hypothetical protein
MELSLLKEVATEAGLWLDGLGGGGAGSEEEREEHGWHRDLCVCFRQIGQRTGIALLVRVLKQCPQECPLLKRKLCDSVNNSLIA